MKKYLFFAVILFAFWQCNTHKPETTSPDGMWLGELMLNDSTTLPFLFTVETSENGMDVLVKNGPEKIALKATTLAPDSVLLEFPVYQTRILAKTGDGIWTGFLEKLDTPEPYRIPFVGSQGISNRLPENAKPNFTLAKRWKTTFFDGTKTIPAIAEFAQIGSNVSGTFITQSGDYRFLDGKFTGNDLTLFGFDGGYIQVFKARMYNDTLRGTYHSGLTGFRTWVATPNDTFALADPAKLSALNPAQDSISFSYPGISGAPVSYNPHAYLNQIVVLQITGSWCPNCKDQARYLQELINRLDGKNLVVYGIAFERMGTLEKSIAAAKKSKENLGISYPVGIAKYNRKQVAEEEFPFLTKIKSYPTLLIIDKKGAVRKIHTGFAGPGTSRFETETKQLTSFIESLINE